MMRSALDMALGLACGVAVVLGMLIAGWELLT